MWILSLMSSPAKVATEFFKKILVIYITNWANIETEVKIMMM